MVDGMRAIFADTLTTLIIVDFSETPQGRGNNNLLVFHTDS